MLFQGLKKFKLYSCAKFYSSQTAIATKHKFNYEIPEYYRKSFFLANSSLVDNTDWFVYNALTIIYDDLMNELLAKGHSNKEVMKIFDSFLNITVPYNHTIDSNFPVKLENGSYRTFRGYRAQHGLHVYKNQPSLGGFRLCSEILKTDIKALAAITTYKHSCMDIDLPGAHGGIVMSISDLSEVERQRIVQAFIIEMAQKGFCGHTIDIFEPDMHCGNNETKWILAGSQLSGRKNNACTVGKPVPFGGIENREVAVGQGILIGLSIVLSNENIMKHLDMPTGFDGKTFILQGLGKVGSLTSTYLTRAGMKCICIAEHDCHITDLQGINIKDAINYKEAHKTLSGYREITKETPLKEVLVAPCDILLIAAGERCMPYYITDKSEAKIVVEVANAPLSPLAHKTLVSRKRLVLPDIFINSGSSIASYYEYLQNMQHIAPLSNTMNCGERLSKLNEVKSKNYTNHQEFALKVVGKNNLTELIAGVMQKVSEELIEIMENYKLGMDLRTAGYSKALKKLFWETYKNKYTKEM